MVSRFDNLRGGDAMGLVDIVQNAIEMKVRFNVDDFYGDIAEILDDIELKLENINIDDNLKVDLIDKLKNDLNFWILSIIDYFKNCFDSRTISRELVDEFGLFGWEVLPPDSVRKIKSMVQYKYQYPRLKILKGRRNGTG